MASAILPNTPDISLQKDTTRPRALRRFLLGSAAVLILALPLLGCPRQDPPLPLDQLRDEAVGMPRVFLEAFVQWMNATLWGDLTLSAGHGGPPCPD